MTDQARTERAGTDRAWADWAAARPQADVLHLDAAAFGRSSLATLAAVSQHARLEAELGGYVAEELAGDRLGDLRRDAACVLGTDAEGVAFVESATAAFEALLGAWPFPPEARVAVPASEWGPNLELLERHGLAVELLAADDAGVLDLGGLEARLAADPPDLVLVDQVASHRGLVQPAAEVVALGRAHGVPVWLDAAQAVGHVRVPDGADAVFATSRKWLTGPRGVGMLAIAERHRSSLRVRRPAKHPDRAPVRLLESEEAHVAGRLGLGVALQEYVALGVDVVGDRLVEVGRLVREAVGTLAGWEVVHPEAPAGSTTSFAPRAGQDVLATRQRLLEDHHILTTVCLPWRAPREELGEQGLPGGPWLRLSPHVDLTAEALERLCEALAER